MERLCQPPGLFSCADRVKVPHVGADASKLKDSHIALSNLRPAAYFSQRQKLLRRDYLQKISSDLLFSEEVVRIHAAHTLPYNPDSTRNVYDYSDIIRREKKLMSGPVGRYNNRNADQHLPCHIKKRSHHRLEPIRRSKPKPVVKDENANEQQTKADFATFMTEEDEPIEDSAEDVTAKSSQCWDEHLLSQLSKNTARWIVGEQTSEGPQKDKLERMLVEIHGEPTANYDTLIHDDASLSDVISTRETNSRRESRMCSRQAQQPLVETRERKEDADAYDDDDEDNEVNRQSLASFYCHPAATRRQQRYLRKESAGATNSTARDIKVTRRQPKPPPTLKDVMNPGVGDKMYDTQNQFEQEKLCGAQQLRLHSPSSNRLLLETGNLYQVTRQEDFPRDPTVWNGANPEAGKTEQTEPSRGHRGYKKWSQLPVAIQGDVSLTIREAGYDPGAERESDLSERTQHKQNDVLLKLVDEWRNKWHLGDKWYDSTIEELARDMSDIHEHVRLQAIATIAKAATYRPSVDSGTPVEGSFNQKDSPEANLNGDTHDSGTLPEVLLGCVHKALSDVSGRVKITAAMTLYTLNRPNEQAYKLLNDVVRSGTEPERWAASQCLAQADVCDSYVVGELIGQLLGSQDSARSERCVTLLARLSRHSAIVHSMIGERLNSTSWRQRVVACRVLPRLLGDINKDITHKLRTIMWNDWHQEVRRAAAQTLGRTGHGREVHDDLRQRLLESNERDRIDALHKIAHLGIMTARLLPAYLQCFNDAYIAVRITATNTAGYLSLVDPKVTKKLLYLTQFDSNWKVKGHAIKALGDIGQVDDLIQEAILWAVRFESEPGVRAEALKSLVKLNIKGEPIAAMLQDKLLVEPDQLVRLQLAIALQSMGVSPTGDMEMVQQIKDEVHRLCTRYNIAAKIAENERREDIDVHKEVYFGQSSTSMPEIKGHEPRTNSRPNSGQDLTVTLSKPDIEGAGTSFTANTPDETLPTDTPDITLPVTPSAGHDVISPVSPAVTPTRGRSPTEKLEKLIELYEGSCTVKEYRDYVQPDDDGVREQGTTSKLETIAESIEEEIRHIQDANGCNSETDLGIQRLESADGGATLTCSSSDIGSKQVVLVNYEVTVDDAGRTECKDDHNATPEVEEVTSNVQTQ